MSGYRTNFKNFIFKRFTGAKCDDDFASCGTGTELDQIVYSQRDATFTGAEVLAEHDIARIWRGVWGIEGRYDFVHAVFDDGSFVPKIPPHRLGGGVYYRDANWLARVNLLHAFAQDEFATFDTPTPGYNLLNAELSYTLKLGQQARSRPRDDHRAQGRKPPRRRHPQQRLLQEGRGAAAGAEHSSVRQRQAQLIRTKDAASDGLRRCCTRLKSDMPHRTIRLRHGAGHARRASPQQSFGCRLKNRLR